MKYARPLGYMLLSALFSYGGVFFALKSSPFAVVTVFWFIAFSIICLMLAFASVGGIVK